MSWEGVMGKSPSLIGSIHKAVYYTVALWKCTTWQDADDFYTETQVFPFCRDSEIQGRIGTWRILRSHCGQNSRWQLTVLLEHSRDVLFTSSLCQNVGRTVISCNCKGKSWLSRFWSLLIKRKSSLLPVFMLACCCSVFNSNFHHSYFWMRAGMLCTSFASFGTTQGLLPHD